MDFAGLPPEINSARMYAGPGSGPLLAAATAWDELAAELHTAAIGSRSVITGLAGGPWSGPSASAMAAAATPHTAWLAGTAAQCAQTAAQLRAAAGAYQAAFAATVPPAVVAANRAELAALVATNFVGQNTAAIAAAEARYGQMWAQDAAAMYGYAAASATAARLPSLTPPTSPPTAAGQPPTPAQSLLPGILPESAVGYLGLITPYTSTIGTVNLATRLASQPGTQAMHDTVDRIAGAVGVQGLWPSEPVAGGTTLAGATGPASAGLGRAATAGSLSVPQAWTAAAPPPAIRTVAHSVPAGAAGPQTIPLGGGPEIVLGATALAALAGRTLTATGGRDNATYTITVTRNPPASR